MRWTEEEKTTMMNLAMSTNMTTQEVTDMLNEKYNNKRTTKSVESKKNRVLEELGIDNKKKDVTIVKTKIVDRNSRKGWTTAEDRVLIDKWTADKNNQERIAESLGRSVGSCASRIWRVKKNPKYFHALIDGTTVNINDLELSTDIAVRDVYDVSDDSFLDKSYRWLKTRKQRKATKRKQKIERKIDKLRGRL
jgi:hypothetical protein